ncbi:metal ABC transporter permease [Aerococcaceae bacterium zg-ZJ1578]|uniref:metal ABC transporter permease n=1 Tax=Aerococcaceae bacterium zg-252 TaxID=2796928 RepID=UPI001A32C42B|nr:metal ABC transporter permease [Aerococcaceae bacterium zg-1578]
MTNLWSNHYIFLVVALGLGCLSVAASVIGSSLVLERQSQLGDAIGHSSYPGIIIAFMIIQHRSPFFLLLGAIGAGLVALLLVHWLSKFEAFHYDSLLALVLSSLFGLGMVLMSYIQGNDNYLNSSQAGLQTYIMGQASYLTVDDVILIAVCTVISLGIFYIFYPKIKLVLFDKAFAASIGISPRNISLLNLLLALLIISVGLKAVGALLISSLLITPTIIAMQWTREYKKMLWIAAGSGLFSALVGTWLSTTISKLATGPTVVLCLFILSAISIFIAPNGIIKSKGWIK